MARSRVSFRFFLSSHGSWQQCVYFWEEMQPGKWAAPRHLPRHLPNLSSGYQSHPLCTATSSRDCLATGSPFLREVGEDAWLIWHIKKDPTCNYGVVMCQRRTVKFLGNIQDRSRHKTIQSLTSCSHRVINCIINTEKGQLAMIMNV